MSDKTERRTDHHGTAAPNNDHSITVGPRGPILMQDRYMFEKMQNFNRERIPERDRARQGRRRARLLRGHRGRHAVVPGPTSSARSASRRRRSCASRPSPASRARPDTWRDPRGFALKFYTEQGNYDLVGNNTPVFFVRDPIKFSDFIHSQKRDPRSGLRDETLMWDFWSLTPESLHQVLWLMGDRGIPESYRHLNGYSSHTYRWINAAGEAFWVKYHFKTDQGIEYFTQDEADEMAGVDPDYHRRDLFQAIESRRLPELDAEGPDHARGRGVGLPLQPVRPDQGLAARRLPAARGRQAGPRPQPRQLLRRDRAVGVRAREHGPRDRALAGQDAAEPVDLLRGRAPVPDRHQLRARADQLPDARRQRHPEPGRQVAARRESRRPPELRSQQLRRPGRRRRLQRERLRDRRRDRPLRLRAEVQGHRRRAADRVLDMLDDDEKHRLVGNIAGHLGEVTHEDVRRRSLEYLAIASQDLSDRVAAAMDAPHEVGSPTS